MATLELALSSLGARVRSETSAPNPQVNAPWTLRSREVVFSNSHASMVPCGAKPRGAINCVTLTCGVIKNIFYKCKKVVRSIENIQGGTDR